MKFAHQVNISEGVARKKTFNSGVNTMTAKQPSHQIGRDARTGQFIPVREAERRPSTTVVETIKHTPSHSPSKKK
jgi:hypothetical protein